MWQKAKVIFINDQTPDFRTIILKPRQFTPFKSGNFVELAIKKNGAFKCYSVVSSPDEKAIEVGVKLYKNGALSPALFKLAEGDEILMRGPTGAHFVWEPSDKNTVLIGGGSGICPMISILRQHNPVKGRLFIVFSTKKNSVYYGDELNRLTYIKKVDYWLLKTGEGKRLNKSALVAKFEKIIASGTNFFVAGPTEFVQNVSLWLYEIGVDSRNIKTDDFGLD